ncbi:ABC transporter substrate-binding protein [Caldilinea sp.]|jgi:putative aldouronate transport system substrate-binding protein|uniref:ABC transporter substrate-binding protein n=1 Tax=Caldilinea sp. TaxID=2293560 RepID=UPI0021DEA553|nr:ABC transporter substrate-binding protein [Caldilinea sp.]GIV68190.1 MAG: ABC transporter substrate-binding protein [Caldilinea sp.]
MKRVLLAIAALALVLSAAACAPGAPTGAPSDQSAATGQPEKVIMTYLHGGAPPADMQLVVDAINRRIRDRINAEIEYYPLPIFEAFTGKYHVLLSSGERIDLMVIPFQNIVPYVDAGLLNPLDELLAQHAPTIMALSQEFPILQTATVRGEVYGVAPVNATYGVQTGFIVNKDWVTEFQIPEKEIYTLDEMGELFGAVKAKYPDMYPVCVNPNILFLSPFPIDSLGASASSGVLIGLESTQIVNLWASQEYEDFVLKMREWYEAGYIPPDAATTTATLAEQTNAGVCAAYPMIMEPVQTTTTKASFGFESVGMPTSINYYPSLSPNGSANWSVPITAKSPEAAVKFLDLMYADHELANMLLWGIEGKHFVKTDVEQVIAFPEGVNGQNSGYYVTYGLYGDRRYEYQWDVRATRRFTDEYTAANMKNPTKAVGYMFDPTGYTNQIIAIDAVVNKYNVALLTGSVADVRGTLEKMNAELKAAGIDEVIAANQAQFDAWLASR